MSNLFNCPDCEKEISRNAASCPNCGYVVQREVTQAEMSTQKKPMWANVAALIIFGTILYGCVSLFSEEELTEKELAIKQEKEAQDKIKGFHCLSSWDGSHTKITAIIENALNDPNSYDHVETRVTPVDESGKHFAYVTYRAKNSFGALVKGTVTASYDHETCEPTILSSE